MSKLTAYIIAYNEAAKIRAAIESVSWADEVLVVDSHSTDGTTEIAQSMGARIVQVPFIGFGDLRNQAIAACTHDWIFSLDADERCTDEVRDEVLDIITSDDSSDVYYIPRKNFFMGRWIKHSGYYPDYRQPQLFRKGTLKYKLDPVHEGFELLFIHVFSPAPCRSPGIGIRVQARSVPCAMKYIAVTGHHDGVVCGQVERRQV